MYKLLQFSNPKIKIGVETTWMLKNPIIKEYKSVVKTTINKKTTIETKSRIIKFGGSSTVSHKLIDHTKNLLNKHNIKFYSVYNDCDTIEICSRPLLINDLKKWYDSLYKILKTNGYVESSVFNLYEQGGLHINIDLLHDISNYSTNINSPSFQKAIHFNSNLQTFYNNNPWVNWMFYEPNEDSVSKNNEIIVKKTYGGDVYINNIGGRNYCFWSMRGYIEFRGYSMPLNKKQFYKYVNFTVLLHNYLSDPSTKLKKTDFIYNEISLSQAKINIRKICKVIGYPIEWLDFTNLELRYSYDDYKKRLI